MKFKTGEFIRISADHVDNSINQYPFIFINNDVPSYIVEAWDKMGIKGCTTYKGEERWYKVYSFETGKIEWYERPSWDFSSWQDYVVENTGALHNNKL